MVIDVDQSPLTSNQYYETPSVENHKERVILKLANTPEIEAVYASLDKIKTINSYLPKLAQDLEYVKPRLDQVDQEKIDELITLIKTLNLPNINLVAENIANVNTVSQNITPITSLNEIKDKLVALHGKLDKVEEVASIIDSINITADLADEIATLISFKNNIIALNTDLDKILSVEKRLPYIITLAKLGQKYLTLQEEKDFTDAQFYDTLVSILEQVELLGTIKEHLPSILMLQNTLDGLEDTLTQYQQLAHEVVTETQGRIREIYGKYSELAIEETNLGLKKIWDAVQTGLDLIRKASETTEKPQVDLTGYATLVQVEQKLNELKHSLETKLGDLSNLSTKAKTDLVSAINEVYSRTSNASGSFDNLLTVNTEQSVTGLKTFTKLPQSTATPEDDKDFVTKKYVDSKEADTSEIEGEITTIKQKLTQFEQSVNEIKENIQTITTKVQEHSTTIDSHTEKLTQLEQKDTQLNEAIETNKSAIEQVKTKLVEIKEVDNPSFVQNEDNPELGSHKFEITIPEDKKVVVQGVYFTKDDNVVLTTLDQALDRTNKKLILYSDTTAITKIVYTVH